MSFCFRSFLIFSSFLFLSVAFAVGHEVQNPKKRVREEGIVGEVAKEEPPTKRACDWKLPGDQQESQQEVWDEWDEVFRSAEMDGVSFMEIQAECSAEPRDAKAAQT